MYRPEYRAPKGKFRIIGYDSFDNDSWIQGDYDTLEEAILVAKEKGGVMTLMHIYDDEGNHRYKAGSW